jgi:hypothetical protein
MVSVNVKVSVVIATQNLCATATCTSVNFPSGVTITNILAVW